MATAAAVAPSVVVAAVVTMETVIFGRHLMTATATTTTRGDDSDGGNDDPECTTTLAAAGEDHGCLTTVDSRMPTHDDCDDAYDDEGDSKKDNGQIAMTKNIAARTTTTTKIATAGAVSAISTTRRFCLCSSTLTAVVSSTFFDVHVRLPLYLLPARHASASTAVCIP